MTTRMYDGIHIYIRRNGGSIEHSVARGGRRVLARHVTLDEAQAHCRDVETSSSTATSWGKRRITELRGPWFDGYEKEGR